MFTLWQHLVGISTRSQISFILLVENRFYLITALVDIEMKPGAISSLMTVLVLLVFLSTPTARIRCPRINFLADA